MHRITALYLSINFAHIITVRIFTITAGSVAGDRGLNENNN